MSASIWNPYSNVARANTCTGICVKDAPFNAKADGFTDDSAAIQAAFDAAPDNSAVIFPPGEYVLLGSITTTKALHIHAEGAKFSVRANVAAFTFYSAPTVYDLTADYTPGALSITIAPLPVALEYGTPFKIVSNAVDPANRDSGSDAPQYRCGEWAHATGGTFTSITLANPLRFSKGISPVSTIGEESVVDAYTTALDTRILFLSGATMSWTGGTIEYEAGQSATWNARALAITGYTRPLISGLSITRGYRQGIQLTGCYHPVVHKYLAANLADNPSLSQFGYGVSDSSYGTLVDGCVFNNTRHGYTTGETQAGESSANLETLLGLGRIQGALIVNCIGYGGINGVFDTHHGAEDVTFQNCTVYGAASYAFTIRGRNIDVIDCKAINTAKGVIFFTEYQSGNTSDDFYVAGKPQGVTSGRLINFTARVTTTPVTASMVRFLKIVGGDWQATSQVMLLNDGSEVEISGYLRCKVTTFDDSQAITVDTSTGVFDVDPITAQMVNADWLAIIRFTSGANVIVDALAAQDGTNTLALMYAPADTQIKNNGYVRAVLSGAFSRLITGLPSSYSVGPEGLLEWSKAGTPDNSMTLGLLGAQWRARALDNSAWYDNSGISIAREMLVHRETPNLDHTGTGAMVTSVYTVGYQPVALIDEAKHYVRVEIIFNKTGAQAGIATIKSRISNVYNADLVFAATDTSGTIVIEVFTTGDNAQIVQISALGSSNTNLVTPASHANQCLLRTVDLGVATYLFRFDVQAAVGDGITFRAAKVYSDYIAYGVN